MGPFTGRLQLRAATPVAIASVHQHAGAQRSGLALYLSPERPEMKVLFMSGCTGGVLGPDGFTDEEIHSIGKPFTRERVARRVRAVLDGTVM